MLHAEGAHVPLARVGDRRMLLFKAQRLKQTDDLVEIVCQDDGVLSKNL